MVRLVKRALCIKLIKPGDRVFRLFKVGVVSLCLLLTR